MTLYKWSAFIGLFILAVSFTLVPSGKQMKCLVQLVNYEGEGAYIIVSVVDKDNNYLTTLRILGDDPEWYHEITSWWDYYGKKRYDLDGITGATIAGGERSVFQISVDEQYLQEGNKLRFETSVEEKDYHEADVEIPLKPDMANAQAEGSGYIRYVRLIAN
jgi:hypothetical protein